MNLKYNMYQIKLQNNKYSVMLFVLIFKIPKTGLSNAYGLYMCLVTI